MTYISRLFFPEGWSNVEEKHEGGQQKCYCHALPFEQRNQANAERVILTKEVAPVPQPAYPNAKIIEHHQRVKCSKKNDFQMTEFYPFKCQNFHFSNIDWIYMKASKVEFSILETF